MVDDGRDLWHDHDRVQDDGCDVMLMMKQVQKKKERREREKL